MKILFILITISVGIGCGAASKEAQTSAPSSKNSWEDGVCAGPVTDMSSMDLGKEEGHLFSKKGPTTGEAEQGHVFRRKISATGSIENTYCAFKPNCSPPKDGKDGQCVDYTHCCLLKDDPESVPGNGMPKL